MRQSVVLRATTLSLLVAMSCAACGAPPTTQTGEAAPAASTPAPVTAAEPTATSAPPPGAIRHGDDSTNLETTPLSAADYAMYAAIMGGASAMLSALTPDDTAALDLAKKVDAGKVTATAKNAPLLERAKALREQDIELARLQGIDTRYRAVKNRIESVIGPKAKAPAANDSVAQENLRYLDAHRAQIERWQKILADPTGATR